MHGCLMPLHAPFNLQTTNRRSYKKTCRSFEVESFDSRCINSPASTKSPALRPAKNESKLPPTPPPPSVLLLVYVALSFFFSPIRFNRFAVLEERFLGAYWMLLLLLLLLLMPALPAPCFRSRCGLCIATITPGPREGASNAGDRSTRRSAAPLLLFPLALPLLFPLALPLLFPLDASGVEVASEPGAASLSSSPADNFVCESTCIPVVNIRTCSYGAGFLDATEASTRPAATDGAAAAGVRTRCTGGCDSGREVDGADTAVVDGWVRGLKDGCCALAKD